MLTVHVRVSDSVTGKPTPVRLRLSDAAGTYRPPLGRLDRFRVGPAQDVGGQVCLGGRSFAYVDGTCEAPLPPGAVRVEVARGPEYAPLEQELRLAPGKLSLRLTIERWADWRADGWYSGDTRAHELSPRAALLEAAAEGLAVVHLLARERPSGDSATFALPNLLDFSGAAAALADEHALVAVNTLNSHPVLGSVALLNCHRPVYPLRFGAPGDDGWSVADWCDQCHRKKAGLVVWSDLPRLDAEHPQGEALAAALLGKVDAFELSRLDEEFPENLALYYRLLAVGLRLSLVGGSGKDSNAVALGSVRTYARLADGEALSVPAWSEAVRAGRTFVTTAPLLSFTANDHGPGAALVVAAGAAIRLRAEAQCGVPFDELELVAGGEVIASKPTSGSRLGTAVETDYRPPFATWVAARVRGGDRLPTGPLVFAHTTPVWIDVPDHPAPPPAVAAPLLDALERTAAWVESRGRFEAARQREHLRAVLAEARQTLLARQG